MATSEWNPDEEQVGSEPTEWIVEFILEIRGNLPVRSVTVLHGEDLDGVRNALHKELTEINPEAMRIDVTVIRMEPVEMETDQTLFDDEVGLYSP